MSKDRGKDRRKDLRLVGPEGEVQPEALDEATEALRSAVDPGALDALDNEALLAMTLGEDVPISTTTSRSARRPRCARRSPAAGAIRSPSSPAR